MNIIKKGAAAIVRSYLIANFDLAESMEKLGMADSLDDILGEGTEEEYLKDYDEVDLWMEGSTIRGLFLTYFALAPVTALLMIWNKLAIRYISKHQ